MQKQETLRDEREGRKSRGMILTKKKYSQEKPSILHKSEVFFIAFDVKQGRCVERLFHGTSPPSPPNPEAPKEEW